MWNARCYVAAAQTVIMYWLRKPEKEWPEYLRDLEKEAFRNGLKSEKKRGIELTMYVFHKKFSKEQRLLGLKRHDEI